MNFRKLGDCAHLAKLASHHLHAESSFSINPNCLHSLIWLIGSFLPLLILSTNIHYLHLAEPQFTLFSCYRVFKFFSIVLTLARLNINRWVDPTLIYMLKFLLLVNYYDTAKTAFLYSFYVEKVWANIKESIQVPSQTITLQEELGKCCPNQC